MSTTQDLQWKKRIYEALLELKRRLAMPESIPSFEEPHPNRNPKMHPSVRTRMLVRQRITGATIRTVTLADSF